MKFQYSEAIRFALIDNLNYLVLVGVLFVQGFFLDPATIGAFYISTLPSFLLLALITQSVNLTVLRDVREAKSPSIGKNFALYVTYLFVLICILLFNTYLTNGHQSLIFGCCIILHSFFEVNSLIYEANLQRKGSYVWVPLFRLISSLLSVLALLIFLFQGLEIVALYLCLVLGALFKYICHRYISIEVGGAVNIGLLRSHLKNHTSYSLLNFTARNVDQYLFSFILGLGAVGVYGRSLQLTQIPIKILNGLIAGLLQPKSIVNKEYLARDTLRLHVSALIIISCGFALFFQYILGDILLALWGPKWGQVSESITYLAPAIIVQAVIGYKTSQAVIAGHDNVLVRVGLINLITVLPVPVFAILYGFDEALFAYSSSYAVIAFPMFEVFVSRRVFNESKSLVFWGICQVSVPIIIVLFGIISFPQLPFLALIGWLILLVFPCYRLFGENRNVVKS